MNMHSNRPARLWVTAAVLLLIVALAGVAALVRGRVPPAAALAAVPAGSAAQADPDHAAALSDDPTAQTALDQAVAVSGSAVPDAALDRSPAVATLGEVRVDRDELMRLLGALPSETRGRLMKDRASLEQWLRARLAEKALVEQARAQGWQERPELKRAFQVAQERIVLQTYLDSVSRAPDDYPAETDLRAAYERAKPRLTQPATYRVSQIFLPAALDDSAAVTAARKQAQDLVKRVRAAPKADFAALAKRYSQDAATRAQGGDVGYVQLAQLTPEMRPVVGRLEIGEVSVPVRSAAGFHILKLVDVRAASVAPYEQVKDELRVALRTQRQEQTAKAYLEEVLNAGTVSIDGAALNAALTQTAAAASAN